MRHKRERFCYGVLIAYIVAWGVGFTIARADGLSVYGAAMMGLLFDMCVFVFVTPVRVDE